MRIKLFLIGVFALVAIASWPSSSAVKAISGSYSVMPSRWVGGGNVSDAGIHFDDGPFAAYDYGGAADAWLRGMVTQSLTSTRIYTYWAEGDCRVRARLRVWDPWTSTWYWDYTADVDVLHLTNRPSSTSDSQTFVSAGNWFNKIVGTASTCGTDEAHSHLATTLSSYVVKTYKADDTCWGTSTQCAVMNNQSVRTHANNTYYPYDQCPGDWSGSYATNRSGGASGSPPYPYACQEWSYKNRSDQNAVYTVTFP